MGGNRGDTRKGEGGMIEVQYSCMKFLKNKNRLKRKRLRKRVWGILECMRLFQNKTIITKKEISTATVRCQGRQVLRVKEISCYFLTDKIF